MAGTHCSNGSPAWLATHPAAEQHAAAVQVRQAGRLRARKCHKNSTAAQLALPCCCSLGCRLTAAPLLVHLEWLLQALLDAGVTIVGKNVMDEMVSWQAAWMRCKPAAAWRLSKPAAACVRLHLCSSPARHLSPPFTSRAGLLAHWRKRALWLTHQPCSAQPCDKRLLQRHSSCSGSGGCRHRPRSGGRCLGAAQ